MIPPKCWFGSLERNLCYRKNHFYFEKQFFYATSEHKSRARVYISVSTNIYFDSKTYFKRNFFKFRDRKIRNYFFLFGRNSYFYFLGNADFKKFAITWFFGTVYNKLQTQIYIYVGKFVYGQPLDNCALYFSALNIAPAGKADFIIWLAIRKYVYIYAPHIYEHKAGSTITRKRKYVGKWMRRNEFTYLKMHCASCAYIYAPQICRFAAIVERA